MPFSPAIAFGVALVVLALAALWVALRIERRAKRADLQPVYVINDAIDYAVEHLDPEVLDRIRRAGVQRIIEWSVHYLQGLAVPARRRRGLRVVAGGEGRAIEYIRGKLATSGYDYSPSDIAAVLAGEAAYLAGIGALGEQVEEGKAV
ncbi:MAG: hypothetical protein J4G11_03860 [Acidimicrobiia bacterium]|nr:hypothetical protein [Acidimicrobiia bacterium]